MLLRTCAIRAIRWSMEEKGDGATSVLQDPEAYPSSLITKDGVPAFSEADWQLTPKAVGCAALCAETGGPRDRARAARRRGGATQGDDPLGLFNSDKPPFSDSPYSKRKAKDKTGKASDHRVTAFLGAACLPAACLRATHRQAPRVAQAGPRRFDFPGFGPGASPLGRSKAEADRGRGQAPVCASHADRSP